MSSANAARAGERDVGRDLPIGQRRQRAGEHGVPALVRGGLARHLLEPGERGDRGARVTVRDLQHRRLEQQRRRRRVPGRDPVRRRGDERHLGLAGRRERGARRTRAGRLAVGDENRDGHLVCPVLALDRPHHVARAARGDRLPVEPRDHPLRLGRLRLRARQAHALDLHEAPQALPGVAESLLVRPDPGHVPERLAAQERQELRPEVERRVGTAALTVGERSERHLGGRQIASPDRLAGGGQQPVARRRHLRHGADPGRGRRGGAARGVRRASARRDEQRQRGRQRPLHSIPPTQRAGAVPNTVTSRV
jgi:hypothetical protein